MIRTIYAVCFKNFLFSEGFFINTVSFVRSDVRFGGGSMNSEPDESLPLGDPPLIEHPTPNGVYLFCYSHRGRKRFRAQFSMALWRHLAEAN